MDTRNSAAIFILGFVLLALWPCVVFAGAVKVYGGNFDLPIPALGEPESKQGKGWMADAVIEVGEHFTILDIDVAITLKHTKVFDLNLFIRSPSGKRICLNDYDPYSEYFDGEDYTQTIFDDEAPVGIEQGGPPFTGRFKPKQGNQLKKFYGDDVFGTWRLQIHDAHYYSVGNLESFELIVTIPEPATALVLTLGTVLIFLRRSRRSH